MQIYDSVVMSCATGFPLSVHASHQQVVVRIGCAVVELTAEDALHLGLALVQAAKASGLSTRCGAEASSSKQRKNKLFVRFK